MLVVVGCADPCVDDGLGQAVCPSQATDDAGGTADSGTVSLDGATMPMDDGGSGTADDDADGGGSQDSGDETDDVLDDDTTADDDGGSDTMAVSASDGSGTSGMSATDTQGDSGSGDASETAGLPLYCDDEDMDGFGDPDACVPADPEDPPDGSVPQDAGEDCDDNDANAFPGAAENDDEDACMLDEDDDGWGDVDPPPGIDPGTDCDDGEPETFPGAAPLDDRDACMQDVDGDDLGDVDPPSGVEAGSDCDDGDEDVAICALLVTQDGTADLAYDSGLAGVLEDLGYAVTAIADTEVVDADADFMTVVVVSETANSVDVGDTFRDVAVPVVCLEGLIWDDMDMAPAPTEATTDDVTILDDGSPLAGGLTGTFAAVMGTGAGLFTTTPTADAEPIAALATDLDEIVYFAYDEGAVMLTAFAAPARRVGLGLDADQGGTTTGQPTANGLTLLQAAVTWAAE